MSREQLSVIGRAFQLEGDLRGSSMITAGNINSTYKVTYEMPDGQPHSYIFQKINTNVFHEPEGIMENIDLVTEHIRSRYPDEVTLHFYHTEDGRNFLYDPDGGFWRVMDFVDSVSFDTSEDPEVIRGTGEAFGRFQNQLADLDGSLLHETIPDFHNTRKRLDTLFRDVEDNALGRNQDAAEEIGYISAVRQEAGALADLYNSGKFPVRVTHNDTKSNNVLFDRDTKQPLVVVDLDTIMPGMSVYDFGDAVRSICNPAAEDEQDLVKVVFDTERFRIFCRGYLGAVGDSLTKVERDNLVTGTFAITVELASRFLDDYLTGDTYFKVDYPGHNLVRTKCQLALARDIRAKKEELERIVAEMLG
ncbi:MAG: aminoglycoside phosphotransferase family protein [Parasporobacterium sp.]|nr:aminoglycoside phosphotransferase family protein [Parasporobacterium sp.]